MPRLIAIDLGAYAVKVSEYQASGRKIHLEARHVQRVPQNGEIPSIEARLEALDLLLDEHLAWAGGATMVTTAWPAEDAALHRVILPFTDQAKVDLALPGVVEGDVPFDLDDMVLGWRSTVVDDESHATAILARHDSVESLLDELNQRGVDPARVIVDADLATWWTREGRTTAVLDIGHTHTLLSVVRDGQVQLFRAINVGGHTFTVAIQRALECSWAEAEARKHGEEIPRPVSLDEEDTDPGLRREPVPASVSGRSGYLRLPPEAKSGVNGAIGLLLAEVRTTLIVAEDTLGYGIDEVRLTGGGARISEIWDYFSHDLGVPVSRAVDPDGDPVPGPFAVSHALGMQFAGLTKGHEVNLRLDDLAYRGGTNLARAALTYGVAGMAFFSMAAVVVFGFQYRSLVNEHNAAKLQLQEVVAQNWGPLSEAELKSTDLMMSKVRFDTTDAVQRADALADDRDAKPPMTDLIFELTQTFPPHPEVTVSLSQLNIDQTTITFKAETDAFASSAAIEERLQSSERFKRAVKDDDVKTPKGRVTFGMRIPLGAEGEEG